MLHKTVPVPPRDESGAWRCLCDTCAARQVVVALPATKTRVHAGTADPRKKPIEAVRAVCRQPSPTNPVQPSPTTKTRCKSVVADLSDVPSQYFPSLLPAREQARDNTCVQKSGIEAHQARLFVFGPGKPDQTNQHPEDHLAHSCGTPNK